MTRYQKSQRKMRQTGWVYFMDGRPIESFPGGGERARAEFEIGWRAAKSGDPKPYSEK